MLDKIKFDKKLFVGIIEPSKQLLFVLTRADIMNNNNESHLVVASAAVNLYLKVFSGKYEVAATKGNVRKLKDVARALHYAGLQLYIELKAYDDGLVELSLWTDKLREDYDQPYHLIGFEHDLDSLA